MLQSPAEERISLHAPPLEMPVVDVAYWDKAMSLVDFIASAQKNQEFWTATLRLARITDDHKMRVRALTAPRRLLVLTEDWCMDGVNTLPVIQKLVDENPLLELRVLRRDDNDVLMHAHMSGQSRAIPVVMALGEDGTHYGWWGSRPSPLQRWRLVEGNALEKTERTKQTRTWYARDRGVTTAEEVLELLELSVTSTG